MVEDIDERTIPSMKDEREAVQEVDEVGEITLHLLLSKASSTWNGFH